MADTSKLSQAVEKLRGHMKGAGYNDEKTGQRHYTPWDWRTPDSIYHGWDGSVWVYRALDLPPWTWADDSDRERYGAQLADVFSELVGITPGGVLPQNMVDSNREFHMVSTTWWEPARSPNEMNPELYSYQEAALRGLTSPRRSLIIGVRLRAKGGGDKKSNNLTKTLTSMALQVLGEDTPDLGAYAKDVKDVTAILKRAGGRLPTRTEQYQLESWYNFGRGPEARIIEEWDRLLIEDFDQIQLAAVSDFHRPILTAPDSTWILDALNHVSGPHVVSVRGKLMPPRQARSKARSAIRWARDQEEQEQKSGDVGRREVGDVYELASIFDDHYSDTRYPLLAETSVVFGRRVDAGSETYVEDLRNRYDIEVSLLLGRQLAALDETLPCSSKRVNPFPQDISTDMLAFSGINSFSELGDGEGALVGITAEDGVPVYMDFLGAPKANQPATMAVFGDSGSGKTVLLQNIATQAALSGVPTVMVNPKGSDTLATFAELVGGRVVSMSRIEQQGGYFDPFRFAEPEIAADIASTFILSVLVEFTERQQLVLRDGLRRGAMEGARCVGEALAYVNDPDVIENVKLAADSEPRIGLGVGWEPAERFQMESNLTLIEFDRDLDLPEPGEKAARMSQRAALAAMQHVVRVSLEMMAGQTGGVLIVDEAWTFLEQAESRAALEGLGRKGRSLNVLPILATQKVADLLKYDMESLLSRVLCLSMRDPEEAAAALELAGLAPTAQRVQFLADCGPRKLEDGGTRIPLAVHRDLQNRHGVIVLGPIPQRALDAFSTNPDDRVRREEERAAAEAAGIQPLELDEAMREELASERANEAVLAAEAAREVYTGDLEGTAAGEPAPRERPPQDSSGRDDVGRQGTQQTEPQQTEPQQKEGGGDTAGEPPSEGGWQPVKKGRRR